MNVSMPSFSALICHSAKRKGLPAKSLLTVSHVCIRLIIENGRLARRWRAARSRTKLQRRGL